jgi:GNAT superfamily N-acetyltransferase
MPAPTPGRTPVAETLRIRAAGVDDLAGVLALYAQPDIDDGDVLPIEEAARIFRRFERYPDYTLYVVEQDGRIVGSFSLLIMDNLGHLGAPSGIVEDVVVDPTQHGRGIGQAMMQFAIARCREQRCYKLMLSSNAKRERAHAFYESLGFARHGYSFRIELERAPA